MSAPLTRNLDLLLLKAAELEQQLDSLLLQCNRVDNTSNTTTTPFLITPRNNSPRRSPSVPLPSTPRPEIRPPHLVRRQEKFIDRSFVEIADDQNEELPVGNFLRSRLSDLPKRPPSPRSKLAGTLPISDFSGSTQRVQARLLFRD